MEESGLGFEDAFTLLVLSLAPQLVLIFELPFLLFDYQQVETMFSVMILRLAVDLSSLRVFYWGLRVVFNVSALKAISVVILPTIAFTIMLVKLIFF